MSLLSNKNIFNISYPDRFYLFCPSPKTLNLLNKFDIIQYNGITIPRIPSDNNNFINLKKILYGIIPLNELIKNSDDNPFKILKKTSNESDNISFINDEKNNKLLDEKNYNDKLNNGRYLLKKNNIIDNKIFSNMEFKENDSMIDLIPPKVFISIIKDYNYNNHINILNVINRNNYNNINKIILKNINNIDIFLNNNIGSALNFKNQIQSKIKTEKNHNESKNPYYQYQFNNIYNKIPDLYSFSLSINSQSNKCNNPKMIFKVNTFSEQGMENKKRRRGRKQTKFNAKVHSASDDDNIIRKIQVHYISFITNYVNDVIRVFIIGNKVPLFKNIDYKIKKNVKYKHIQELKSKTIADIIQLRVSPKMKKHDEFVNQNIYKKVCSLCPFISLFLQRNYISLFKEYYYNHNKLFIVNGKIIPLSIKTKTFQDLINKNSIYKEKLKYIAVNYFLNNHKRYKK